MLLFFGGRRRKNHHYIKKSTCWCGTKLLSTRRDFHKPYCVRIEENLNVKAKTFENGKHFVDGGDDKKWKSDGVGDFSQCSRDFQWKGKWKFFFEKTLLSLANVSIVGFFISISPSIIPFVGKTYFSPTLVHNMKRWKLVMKNRKKGYTLRF